MRQDDFFRDNELGDVWFDDDLIVAIRRGPIEAHTDVEVAVALASLLRDEFAEYGQGRHNRINQEQSRDSMRALLAVLARIRVEFTPPLARL